MEDEHEGKVEENAYIHVDEVYVEENQIVIYDRPLYLTDEVDGTSVLGGKDEDAKSCPTYDDYEKMLKSIDVEDSTTLPLFDSYDEVGSRMIAPTHDYHL
jgi:hypothetical protein